MQEFHLYDMWFPEDVATCHTARVTMDLWRGEFGEHFISRSGSVNWQPRSCDLMPFDYFLWGYVKAHVYTDKSASIVGRNVGKSLPKAVRSFEAQSRSYYRFK